MEDEWPHTVLVLLISSEILPSLSFLAAVWVIRPRIQRALTQTVAASATLP